MKFLWAVKVWFGLAALFVLSGIGQSVSQAETSLSVDDIVQKAVGRAQRTETKSSQPGYSYTKVTLTEELDATGKVREHKEKVYQVSFQAGSTHVKLVEVNGRAPAEADVKKQAENEFNARRVLGQSKSGPGDNHENFLTPELVARFDFKLAGQTVINGRAAYEIGFQPRAPSHPCIGLPIAC